MRAVTAERAKEDFSRVMQLVNETDDDVMITGDGGRNYVLISEENWRSLSETAYLNSIPGLSESILEGGKGQETHKKRGTGSKSPRPA